MAKKQPWETATNDKWANNIPRYRDASGRLVNTIGDTRPQSQVNPSQVKGVWKETDK